MKQAQNASDAGSNPPISTERTFMRLQSIYVLLNLIITLIMVEAVAIGFRLMKAFF
jgi:hypothetical protein